MTLHLFGWLVDVRLERNTRRGASTLSLVVTTAREGSPPYVRGLSLVWLSEEARWHG